MLKVTFHFVWQASALSIEREMAGMSADLYREKEAEVIHTAEAEAQAKGVTRPPMQEGGIWTTMACVWKGVCDYLGEEDLTLPPSPNQLKYKVVCKAKVGGHHKEKADKGDGDAPNKFDGDSGGDSGGDGGRGESGEEDGEGGYENEGDEDEDVSDAEERGA